MGYYMYMVCIVSSPMNTFVNYKCFIPNERERIENVQNPPYEMISKHATKHLKLMTNIYTT